MGHRKVVSVAATMTMATAAGAVGAIASPPPPVAAGPDSVYTYHANICGSYCMNGSWNALNGIKWWVANRSDELGIGLSETCGTQYQNMKTYLRDLDANWYAARHYNRFTNDTICGGSGGGGQDYFFGVVAFGKSPDGPENRTFDASFAAQDPQAPDEAEVRGYACFNGGTAAWNMFCTAHMTSKRFGCGHTCLSKFSLLG